MSKYTRQDEDLVELLWQDGNVILHKQTHRQSTPINEPDRDYSFRCDRTYSKPSDPIPDDVTTPWFQHSIDDTLGRDLCTEFFFASTSEDPIDAIEVGCRKFVPAKETSTFNCLLAEDNIFPTRLQACSTDPQTNLPNTGSLMNSHCQSLPMKINTGQEEQLFSAKAVMNPNHKDIRQSSSAMTKMSSKCSSNHIATKCKPCQPPQNNASSSREVTNAQTTITPAHGHVSVPTITSSSGGSGSSIGRTIHQNSSNSRQKRKQVEIDDTEFQSEDGEDYSIDPSKQLQRSGSTRRSRSAEVHNLSERKRRDRINEKLKALQDLIPHCSKTDKASVLDEAIEYLKTLQMQLQIMWMGSGMAQMMLPNLQHYFSSLSMGMPHAPMTPMPGSIQIPGLPMFNQHVSPIDATNRAFPIMAPINNASQMPSLGNTDMYARYLGFLQMQQTPKLNPSTDSAAP